MGIYYGKSNLDKSYRLSPPEGEAVYTKIDDQFGCRNECILKRSGNLWFQPDGGMYVRNPIASLSTHAAL